ncbi:Annexin D5 [Acorus calamus]|uniref:Annexin n=1 Tax=Acorus calamus TaxID=4465 RepID=A0AAV9C6A9_ACOCL|nr:Annexin D5 [Acorus calamus]KAK1284301.1 Annexin D5 [Acorus calamus]
MSTLNVPPNLTSPRQDAIDLYKAFKGFGCDTAAVVKILAHRDAMQRALIQQEYRSMYSEDLTKRLSKELSGKLETAVLLWMHDPAGRDATAVWQAFQVSDLRGATEVICSRTPSQIQVFKQAYHAKFGVHLEQSIHNATTGDHNKILLAYIGIGRYEGPEIDLALVEKDAKALFKAGEKRLGTDENVFIQIFSHRSRAQLAAVAAAYNRIYGTELTKAVKKETSGDFEYALLTILRCAENPAKYFAKVLHKAMKGLGTNDTTLIRVVVTRTEIDMYYIKAEFHKQFGKSLGDWIHSETSGHYRTFLLSLIGTNH